MRSVIKYAVAALCLFLFSVGVMSLVETPPLLSDEPAEKSAPISTSLNAGEVTNLPSSGTSQQNQYNSQLNREGIIFNQQYEFDVAGHPVSDTNRRPLQCKTYVRSAYNAFPPSDMPG